MLADATDMLNVHGNVTDVCGSAGSRPNSACP